MHLNDYNIGDEVELTKHVCESRKGDRGIVYGTGAGGYKAIRFPDNTAVVTGHIKLIRSADTKLDLLNKLAKGVDEGECMTNMHNWIHQLRLIIMER